MNNLETNEKSLLLELKEVSSGYEGNTIIKDINLKPVT
jgi:ABC-type molybdenum transport system ATPase subunit/photorepair protein PhrA